MQFAPTEARLIKVLNAAMAAFGQGLYDSIRKPNGSYFHVYEDISELENYCDFTITDNDYWDIVYECLEEAVKKPMTY